MSATTEQVSVHLAREAVTIACRAHGRKRGWHLAAALLGVSERVVKAIAYGEPARPDAVAAAKARLAMAEQRLAQLDAEAEKLREIINAARNPVDVGR